MTGYSDGALQCIYGRKSKRVTLQRSLVSLIMFRPEEVSYKHLVVLFDNMLWFQDKAAKDPDFKQKFGITLKVLAYILKNMNLSTGSITKSQIAKLSKKFQENLKHFSLDKRNFRQPLKQQWNLVEVRSTKPLGISTKKLPPERYIGIGYRDKGTAKQPWIDGSPSWQEVASVPIERLPL